MGLTSADFDSEELDGGTAEKSEAEGGIDDGAGGATGGAILWLIGEVLID